MAMFKSARPREPSAQVVQNFLRLAPTKSTICQQTLLEEGCPAGPSARGGAWNGPGEQGDGAGRDHEPPTCSAMLVEDSEEDDALLSPA